MIGLRLSKMRGGALKIKLVAMVVVLALGTTLPNAATRDVGELEAAGVAMRAGLKAARAEQWDEAKRIAVASGEGAAETLVEWLRLRAGGAEWRDYQAFLANHDDWPGLKILRRSGEAAIPATATIAAVESYFAVQSPQTGAGALALALARRRHGDKAGAIEAIVDGWKGLPFNASEREQALEEFGPALRDVHWTRLDTLLWHGRTREAAAILPLVGKDRRQLARTRLALMDSESGLEQKIAALSPEMKRDPGLAYERVRWRWKHGHPEGAITLMLERSQSARALGRPDKWADLRFRMAHRLMRQGQFRTSYRIAASHQIGEGDEFFGHAALPMALRARAQRSARLLRNDLEWHAGYVALRHVGEPRQALTHFRTFRDNVKAASQAGTGHSPISHGRAGYWLGRTFEVLGDTQNARAAYAYGAEHQISFYGQLAAARAGIATSPRLASGPGSGNFWRRFRSDQVVRAGLIYHHAGQSSESGWFLAHRAETLEKERIDALCRFAMANGAYFAMVKTAKQALKQGDLLPACLFPMTGAERRSIYVAAVARQETEFRGDKISRSGAVGLMQLLPGTGDEMATKIGMRGELRTLLRDNQSNLRLGAAYIDEMKEEFDGSLPLVFAAYNAGPGRVRGWLGLIGDPRHPDLDPIDWIERIPFNETRNYVMRVMESAAVYDVRLNGPRTSLRLARDLVSGR